MEISLDIAAIVGPILMALAISEYRHLDIWKNVDPTVVYLNGLVLFAGGLVLVRFHNIWRPDWTVVITLISWLCLLLGLFRMMMPRQPQLKRSRGTNVMLLVMLLLGGFLSVQAYLLH